MRNPFNRIRVCLILLVLLVVFPSMILIIGYVFWEQQREARLQAQETAIRVARLAASEQERLISSMEYLLRVLAELPAVRSRNSKECSKLFADLMRTLPLYTNIAAVSSRGDVFCSGPSAAAHPSIAEQFYFRKAIEKRSLAISQVSIGRMSGKPTITMAYPAFDVNGGVHAVLVAAVDLDWLNSVASRAELPPYSILMIVDSHGSIFARTPESEKWVGKSAMTPLVKTLIEQKEGVTEAEDLDGVRRLHGFTTLHSLADNRTLFLSVGIAADIAFASSKRVLNRSLFVLLFTWLLAGVGTWVGTHLFIRRRLEDVITAARALGEVEPQQSATEHCNKVDQTVDRFEQVIQEMRVSLNKVTERQADFAAMIAHDLRNPVQTIAFAASLLRDGIERQEDEQLSMLSIEEACDTLIRILDEFLLFSRYRAGYLKLKKEPVDVGDWLRKTQRKYAGRSRQSKVSLEIDVEPGVGFISADREKLDRLLDNLVNNALKFTREEGQIELGARTAGDGVEFWVRDTGIGIAPDEAKSLFGKYQQADSAKAHQKQGTGLGLLICKMIAVEHGGQIRVEGELNQGTTFYVWIPRQSSDYLATGTVGWLGVASRILLT